MDCNVLLKFIFWVAGQPTKGHLEQKRAKEDSDALFLIQMSHFLVTSDRIWKEVPLLLFYSNLVP